MDVSCCVDTTVIATVVVLTGIVVGVTVVPGFSTFAFAVAIVGVPSMGFPTLSLASVAVGIMGEAPVLVPRVPVIAGPSRGAGVRLFFGVVIF